MSGTKIESFETELGMFLIATEQAQTDGLTIDRRDGGNAHIDVLVRSEEHTSELQSQSNLVCRLLLEKKNITQTHTVQAPTATNFIHTQQHHCLKAKGLSLLGDLVNSSAGEQATAYMRSTLTAYYDNA